MINEPTKEQIIKEYKLTTLDEAAALCAHLLWYISFKFDEIERIVKERDELGNQLWKLVVENDELKYAAHKETQ